MEYFVLMMEFLKVLLVVRMKYFWEGYAEGNDRRIQFTQDFVMACESLSLQMGNGKHIMKSKHVKNVVIVGIVFLIDAQSF